MINKIKNFFNTDIKNDKYALSDDKTFGKVSLAKSPTSWVRSTCGYCGVGCGLYIGVKDGKPVLTKGDPAHPVNQGTLCPKGLSEHEIVNSTNRYTTPMIKKYGHIVPSTWDEVFKTTSDKFKQIQEKHGNGAVAIVSTGQLLTEEFYTLGKFAQIGLKTNNYCGNTTLCMASAVMGYKQTFGSDGPVGCYEDFSHADVIMLIGANIADNHPILKLHIAKNRKTTGKKPTIIVVDPRFSKTANMADIYVPILPRSDLSLMNGLCYIILEQGWEDEKFISNRTTGYKEFRKHIFENYKPQDVSITTGIEVKDLYQLAKVYAKAPKAMSAWTMGVNQSSIGTDTVSAICNLALITGNLGREGATAFSITGQCNAMGTREAGFTSSIPGYRNFASSYDREEYATLANVPVEDVPTKRGYSYPQIIDAILEGEIKALWLVATNPLVSFPDQNKLRKAFEKLEFLVVQDAFKSETSLIADVVFSAATWGEKEGVYTNSERRCNYAKKAVEPIGDTKSDFNIILEFSKYFDLKDKLFPSWSEPRDAFNEWKKVSSNRLCDYSGMSYELIEELGGIQWPCNEKYPKGKQRLYDENMPCPTESGKATLLCLDWKPLKESCDTNFPIVLNTGRTVEQWHTRTKTKTIAILNDLAPEAWVEINPVDAKKLQVTTGERLDISSSRGRINNVIVKESQNIRVGTIFVPFHFSEQLINAITIGDFDPKSFEPNFKQCAVQLHSQKVPDGIKLKEEEIAGSLEHMVIKDEILVEETIKQFNTLKERA